MTQVINPKIEVKVYASNTLTIRDLFMDFEITKDLEEESNEATLHIYNLNEGTRRRLTDRASQSAPVEIYLTASGSEQLVMTFRGEIESARHRKSNPGFETVLQCTSQQSNHRSMSIDQKTFTRGTSISSIVEFFIESVNLPTGIIDSIPTEGILISESFSGPAFPLLQRYAFDVGMYAYILDGKINITSIYEPPSPTVIPIYTAQMLATPEPVTRNDDHQVEMKTVVESTMRDPFAKNRKRRKKKKFVKVFGSNDYVEYETVDKLIEGIELELTLMPNIQPDSIINPRTDELKNRMFRVQEVIHHGNNEDFQDWTTEVKADAYYDEDGDLLAGLE